MATAAAAVSQASCPWATFPGSRCTSALGKGVLSRMPASRKCCFEHFQDLGLYVAVGFGPLCTIEQVNMLACRAPH